MNYVIITPPLKWAGGKTQLLQEINKRLPKKFNRYFEPFIGGGAVLFNIRPTNAVINDINEALINLYLHLRDNNEQLIKEINNLDNKVADKEYFLLNRENYNKKLLNSEYDIELAALMIWLNKHCFNGLYRVNSKGLFNVPYNNRQQGKSIIEDNIKVIGYYLNNNNVTILNNDFEEACLGVKAGDFVYFDSPYLPISDTAYFTDYNKNGFTMSDHKRLAGLFAKLDKLGAKIMLSNNDVPLIYELYGDYQLTALEVKRMINSKASNRRGREIIVTNYNWE